MQERHFIDAHKGATAFFILALILWRDAWDNTTALVYLAMHGGYGFMWVMKSRLFPDRSWQRPCDAGKAMLILAALSLYWIAPTLIVLGNRHAPPGVIAAAVALFGFGVFTHFVADMQKYTFLHHNAGTLLDSGLWARLRNPNYFGELLIYLSFVVLAMHWLPCLVLAVFVAAYWVPNMLRKDRSLSRYPGFAAYRARSWRFIPLLW